MTWSGNSEVGEGKMTLTESRPNELVKAKSRHGEAVRGLKHLRVHVQAGGRWDGCHLEGGSIIIS